ncbi:MAG: chemotaxis protein CheX [Cellvibrionaceae bacterium]|jgi:chemotaxis protein CheX
MNDESLKMFVECSSLYFQTITDKPAVVGAPFLIKDINKYLYDYTGIIGISGSYKGSVFFSTSNSMLVQILSAFGILSTDEGKVMDLVGEACNTIAGNARREFGDQFMLSTPIVLKGKSESVKVTKVEQIYIIPITWRQHQANLIINIE